MRNFAISLIISTVLIWAFHMLDWITFEHTIVPSKAGLFNGVIVSFIVAILYTTIFVMLYTLFLMLIGKPYGLEFVPHVLTSTFFGLLTLGIITLLVSDWITVQANIFLYFIMGAALGIFRE